MVTYNYMVLNHHMYMIIMIILITVGKNQTAKLPVLVAHNILTSETQVMLTHMVGTKSILIMYKIITIIHLTMESNQTAKLQGNHTSKYFESFGTTIYYLSIWESSW